MSATLGPENYLTLLEELRDTWRSKEHEVPWSTDTLGPEDYLTALQELQNAWRSKEHEAPWSTDNMSEIDLGDVDWHNYDPPAMLGEAPSITSQIILDIVSSSVDNVKTRIAEEDRLKREAEEEEARRIAEESSKVKGKEPYLPIIILPEEECLAESSARDDVTTDAQSTADPQGTSASPVKEGKRRRFALRRLFQRNVDKGESSAAGSAREILRQKLEARISAVDPDSADPRTQEAIAALRKNRLFKAPDPDDLVECVSCLDEIPVQHVVKVPCHSYCLECFVRLVTASVQNEQQWPPKCCLNQIPFKTVLKNIPEDVKKTFHKRSSEWEIPVSERVYCHAPECSGWIKPSKINLAKRQGRCERGHYTCTICRGQAHGTNECPQDQDLNLTNLLAEEEGWKRCYVCHALVEHKDACQHMTCLCGAEFCYVCGLQWRTCACTMQQLQAIKETTDVRREERQLREQVDAEELREILAQIEEFERQEAWKVEQEMLELERLEEERWQRQVQERIRNEHIRRREVEVRYHQLREMLDGLHWLQQTMVDARQGEEAKDLVEEAKLMKGQLLQKQEAERADLDSLMLVKMRAKEDVFSKEYAVRVVQERRMEEDYHQQLRDFWGNKTGGEDKVEAGMLPLRQRMDQAYRAWQRWRNEELNLYRAKLEDARTMREEIMYSSRKRMDASYADKEVELARRKVAERKWVQEVILERERLLGEMEVQEMEGDADSLFAAENEEEGVARAL